MRGRESAGGGARGNAKGNSGAAGPRSSARDVGTASGGGTRAPYYAEHWSPDEVLAGVEAGRVLLGSLRINARRPRLEAYVSVPGLSRDLFIEGDAARNRALEGDLVAVELLPEVAWGRNNSGDIPGGGGAGAAVAAATTALSSLSLAAADAMPVELLPQVGGAAHDSEPALPEAAAAALSRALWQPDAAVLAVAPPSLLSHSVPALAPGAAAAVAPSPYLPARFAAVVRASAAYSATVASMAAKTGARGGGGGAPPQACARVVSIVLAVHSRCVVGVLRAADDAHSPEEPIPDRHAYVRLVPLDARVPYLLIPRTDVPPEERAFFDSPASYTRKLFAATLGRWGAAGRFPLGHLKGGFGEAGEIASETAVREGVHKFTAVHGRVFEWLAQYAPPPPSLHLYAGSSLHQWCQRCAL